jgi:RNA polymerase sigma-70 factor (ECF subfamily)
VSDRLDETGTGVDVVREIQQLRPVLCHMAVRMTGNRADAEDLVQLALMKALERRGRLRADSNLKAWLRTVMHHQVIDQTRREHRRVPWRQEMDQLPAQGPVDEPDVDPWASAAGGQPTVLWESLSSDDVKQALARCPDPLRRPFEMQQFDGRSLSEISVILGVPRATVATRLFRARARLRRLLTPQA